MTGIALVILAPALPDDLPHPFAGALRQGHGAFATLGILLFGFMLADHARKKLKTHKYSADGLLHLALWTLLIISGYLLYYPLPWMDMLEVHWWLGIALIAILPLHIARRKLRGKLLKVPWVRHLLMGGDARGKPAKHPREH